MSVSSMQEKTVTRAALTAATLMRGGPRTCSPQSTVIEAVLIFKDEDCALVPVVDGGKPVGVVTDRDVALGLARKPDLEADPVSEIMSKNPDSVGPNASVVDIASMLAKQGRRRLLVVDDNGLLIGTVGWSDIAPHLSFTVLESAVETAMDTSHPLTS